MTTLEDSTGAGSVGSINTQTTPLAIDRPVVEDGWLVLLGGFLASHLGTTSGGITDIVDLDRVTSYGGSNRLGGVFLAVVDDAAAFNAAADFILKAGTSATTTRTLGVVGAYAPAVGKVWDLSSVVAAGPESNASAQTNDFYPTIAARTDTFGIAMTNKGPSVSLTKHQVPDGTLLIQQRSASGATNENPPTTANSNSVSDSVVSIARIPSGGGAQVNFVAQNADLSDGAPLSQASGACITFTVAIDQIDDGPGPDPLPTVTGKGFGTVQKFLQTRHADMAHRNAGLGTYGSNPADGYPEMTEYGIRRAANDGFGLIEISCQRTSTGDFIGAHDETFDRVTEETTYDGQNYSARTTAEILALHVNRGTTGGAQPYATLQTLISTLPDDFIFLIDPKQAGGTPAYLTAFMDIVDSLLGPSRAIIKIDGAATASRFQAVKNYVSTSEPGVQYLTAAYWYDTTTNFSTSIPPKMPYVDLAGLNADPNLAADSYWTDLRAMCDAQTAIDGKQRYIWAHVIQRLERYDAAIAKGADFLQVSNAALFQRGVAAWRPAIGPDGFAEKEIYRSDGVTTELVTRAYKSDGVTTTLIWEREP